MNNLTELNYYTDKHIIAYTCQVLLQHVRFYYDYTTNILNQSSPDSHHTNVPLNSGDVPATSRKNLMNFSPVSLRGSIVYNRHRPAVGLV